MTTPAHARRGDAPAADPSPSPDLVCVSYLAHTTILKVDAYPQVNQGAVVRHVETSIAADGPIVAVNAARLGLHVALIANDLGGDPAAAQLIAHLNDDGVQHSIKPHAQATPHLTVITDDAGTRTWFAHLDSALAALSSTDLNVITRARMVYIDCYHAINCAAARAIRAAESTPLLLNLGGDPATDTITNAAAGRTITSVQTNLDETRAHHAADLTESLLLQFRPQAVVVTLGALGALVRTGQGSHRVPAPSTSHGLADLSLARKVAHTHGAGAAFSAGYAHAVLHGSDALSATRAGCHAGTTYCLTGTIDEEGVL